MITPNQRKAKREWLKELFQPNNILTIFLVLCAVYAIKLNNETATLSLAAMRPNLNLELTTESFDSKMFLILGIKNIGVRSAKLSSISFVLFDSLFVFKVQPDSLLRFHENVSANETIYLSLGPYFYNKVGGSNYIYCKTEFIDEYDAKGFTNSKIWKWDVEPSRNHDDFNNPQHFIGAPNFNERAEITDKLTVSDIN